MDKITRFHPEVIFSRMVDAENGDYVRYEDHCSAIAQAVAEEREAIITICEQVRDSSVIPVEPCAEDVIIQRIRARTP